VIAAAVRTMLVRPVGMRALAHQDGPAAMFVLMRAETAARSGMTAPARAMRAGRERWSAGRSVTLEDRVRARTQASMLGHALMPAEVTRPEAEEMCAPAVLAVTACELAALRAQVSQARVRGLAALQAQVRRPCRPPLRQCCTVSGTSVICRRLARWSATGSAWLCIRLLRIAVLAWL
jgi:hypothetical protein